MGWSIFNSFLIKSLIKVSHSFASNDWAFIAVSGTLTFSLINDFISSGDNDIPSIIKSLSDNCPLFNNFK